ncbi:hypothetical protein MADRUGA_1 [Mycobacterium phage Madruga]|uniref:Uncharacterized protein n=1 Tax=Mycobacterium phage Madruga TaxID=1675552 RepID=A0A0K1LRU0_9CAUD|nr:hypothetical protein MADRUGA_1 [Mycobacterium phage Madruga]
MTRPLRTSNPGKTEFSHGKSRAPHPDSDVQSGRGLPFDTAERNQGAKRGGFTQAMRQQAERRLDATRSDEVLEDMLYVKGNPDTGSPDSPIVQEARVTRPAVYRQPNIRTGVDRQD